MPEEDVLFAFLIFFFQFFTHTLRAFGFIKAGTAVSPLLAQDTEVPLVSQVCPCTWTPRSGISTAKRSTHCTAPGRRKEALYDLPFNLVSTIVLFRLFRFFRFSFLVLYLCPKVVVKLTGNTKYINIEREPQHTKKRASAYAPASTPGAGGGKGAGLYALVCSTF